MINDIYKGLFAIGVYVGGIVILWWVDWRIACGVCLITWAMDYILKYRQRINE